MIKNTISSLGIIFATHNMLFYIIDSKKIFQPVWWVKTLWYLMENGTYLLWWKLPRIYIKILMPTWTILDPPPLHDWESAAILKENRGEASDTKFWERNDHLYIWEKKVTRRNKEKKNQNEKYNKRKWHIFVLTGRFCCYFTQQDLPVNQTWKPAFSSYFQESDLSPTAIYSYMIGSAIGPYCLSLQHAAQ